MHRRDEGARPAPKHPTVRGHVEDVELVLPCDSRQDRMVPREVLGGSARAGGNRDETHRIPDGREHRRIVVEREDDELIPRKLPKQGGEQVQHVLAYAAVAALEE